MADGLGDPRVSGVVGGERERPAPEALTQLAEQGERGGRRSLRVAPLVPARRDREPIAFGGRGDELPDAKGAGVRVGAGQERALDDRYVLEVLGKPGSGQLPPDVGEVPAAPLQPENHWGGIPRGEEKLPFEALPDVPLRQRDRLAREVQFGGQLKGVESAWQRALARLEPVQSRPEPFDL